MKKRLTAVLAFLTALLMAACASATGFIPGQVVGEDTDYGIEYGVSYKITYAKVINGSVKRNDDSTPDSLPEFMPVRHGIRNHCGMWLEVPVAAYMHFEGDGSLYWIVDYIRLKDADVRMDVLNGEETREERMDGHKPDYLSGKPGAPLCSLVIFPYVVNGKQVKYEVTNDVRPIVKMFIEEESGEQTIVKQFIYERRSKMTKTIEIKDLDTNKVYKLEDNDY